MDLEAELSTILAALNAAGIDHAVCGGVAVAIHGFVRTTKDIDLLVDGADLEDAVQALEALGYTLDSGDIPFAVGTDEERHVRRISKAVGNDLLSVDLLQVCPVLRDVWESVEVFDWHGRQITVVSAGGLAKMKRLSGRPQDLVDLKRLGLDEETK